MHNFNEYYHEECLDRIAFPLGGMGSGMFCLEGAGAISHVSLRNKPEVFNEPCVFSAIYVKSNGKSVAKVLEGQVPKYKFFGNAGTGVGAVNKTYGLPRFSKAEFLARFPFAHIDLTHDDIPLGVKITGWSPFTPGDSDKSSLPVAALEFNFKNTSNEKIETVYSFNARNFMATDKENNSVKSIENGFILRNESTCENPLDEGDFCAVIDDEKATVNCAWFRGGWFDPLTVAWKNVEDGTCQEGAPVSDPPSPGASIYVPFELAPNSEKTVKLMLSWYVPKSEANYGKDPQKISGSGSGCGCDSCAPSYEPWYCGQFKDVTEVANHWKENYDSLRKLSQNFSDSFYNMTLPPEVQEAVAANLAILKSPTVLRQKDGRLWCWEGCSDDHGCCAGSCTHVWNYAQALPHLFPDLERSLREVEHLVSQDDKGHQTFRTGLPIREIEHEFMAASDGQLGGIMKVYRDWRIKGDTEWLKTLWPQIKNSLDFCIKSWDPDHIGILIEPHHNTYDIEFWGPNGMCSSFYLGGLKAAFLMGEELGEDVSLYKELFEKGKKYLEEELFDGEYFYQKIMWKELKSDPLKEQTFDTSYTPEAQEVLQREGPKYQYGTGCISDGVLGAWMAEVCGVGETLDPEKVKSHLNSIYKYNYRKNFLNHANPQRPAYACPDEGGVLLCSWPKGDKPTLPFVYSDEVWTGIEYHVASHLIMEGQIEEGLEIVRTLRKRYDGKVRNPFNEYECGHWYARAMSSYALLQALTGIRYDAVTQTLYIDPKINGDFTSFLAIETGYGNVGIKDGKPFVDVKEGMIEVKEIKQN